MRRSLATDLRKHTALLAILTGLQLATIALPFLLWFRYTNMLSTSWLGRIANNFTSPLVMLWTWVVCIVLIGVGAYWSAEMNDGIYLSAWRHRSFTLWLWQRLCFALLISVTVLGLGLLPPLAIWYRHDISAVMAAVGLLMLYNMCLSLLFIASTLLGVRTSIAFGGVLLFHVVNVTFDGLNWPNAIRYFLIGEHASVGSALVAGAGVVLLMSATALASGPTAISARGSEYE